MKIELIDQPILIIKSPSPSDKVEGGLQKETLLQIESILEDEILEVREKIEANEANFASYYLTNFNLHLQTDREIISVVLESEWQEQMGDEIENHDSPENLLDLKISDLKRIVKISYSKDYHTEEVVRAEKKKLFKWLSAQDMNISLISGIDSADYLLVSAKDILTVINHLHSSLSEKME